MKYIAHDTETTLIGINNIVPDLICSSFYDLEVGQPEVLHWSPKEAHVDRVAHMIQAPGTHIIYHNASFDLAVLSKFEWDVLPSIWEALEEGRIHDTLIREMLLNLTTSGSIDIVEQHGIKRQVSYSLAALVLKYLNIDITGEKDAEDSVRTNYEAVMHKPLEEWPEEYITYAGKDAEYTGLVFLEQEKARQECIQKTGYDPFVKESFIVTSSLSLQFMTAQGNKLDKEKVSEVTKDFLTKYNDDELVWPLVHSSWIQKTQQRYPDLSALKLVAKAREEWEAVTNKKYWDGSGMLIPAQAPVPNARGTKDHQPDCIGHPTHPGFRKGKTIKECECPVKMNKAKPEKGSDVNLHRHVWEAARRNPDIKVWLSGGYKDKMKEAGLEVPHPIPQDFLADYEEPPALDLGGPKPERMLLQVNKEWLATYAALDPVLEIYNERHKIQKIVTSYLPCLYWADGYRNGCPLVLEGQTDKFAGKSPADRVHAQFAPLKETGRTSSYAAKKGKGNSAKVLYPSWNGQQVDPRIRQCVVPSEGNVLFSIDYSAMELGTAAQISYNLLGYEGVLMKLINDGCDTHSYLGAQIALALDVEHARACGMDADDPMKSYTILREMASNKELCDSPIFRSIFEDCYLGKKWGDHEITWEDCTYKQYYKHFRTFGKPTGLGFWGGLGEPTFVSMAKASYGIRVDIPTAKVLRNIWRTYIPEGQQYLNFVNKQMVDGLADPEIVEDEHGRSRKRNFYCYDTPLGMHRAKCTYTAAANGCALQSPSAEGALGAVQEIMKESTIGSLAGYVFPSLFIHDEIFGEAVYDSGITERVRHMEQIMVDNMQKIATPDVKARAESALMLRWDKRAEEVKDSNGKLIPWEPED
jgi:hypothetical protein